MPERPPDTTPQYRVEFTRESSLTKHVEVRWRGSWYDASAMEVTSGYCISGPSGWGSLPWLLSPATSV